VLFRRLQYISYLDVSVTVYLLLGSTVNIYSDGTAHTMSEISGEVCHKLKRLKTEMLGLYIPMQQPTTTWLVYLQFRV
jgi:hypothetical protein